MSIAQTKRPHPSELTDKIKALRARFEKRRHTGIQADPDGVALIISEFDKILELAWELKEHYSATGWNRMGISVAEADAIEAVLAAAGEPSSNIRLFPGPARPFSDGRDGGLSA